MYNYDEIQNYYNYLNNSKSNIRNDYYNYQNNNYNQPMYTEDANASKLYDPYQGFIRGNMFPNLYNGYKINPMEITPANEQADLLTYLDALCFATVDINLYLDIYPDDKDMIALFNQYRKELNKIKEEYQLKYGPILTDSNSNEKYPFAWINSPWPWESK
jgi:spore coat protein JB